MPSRENLVHWIITLFTTIFIIIFFSQIRHVRAEQVGHLISGSERDQQSPAVAYADEASYLIVWQDFRSGTSFDIYGAGSCDGETLGPFPICTVSRDQKAPSVAWDDSHYVVVWEDNRDGNFFNIYGVRISKSGALMDGPATSSGKSISTASEDQINPDLVWNGKDYFLVVWEDYRHGEADIYGTRVDKDLALYDGPADDGGLILCQKVGDQKAPSVAWNGIQFLVVWEDHVSAEATDIRGLRVSPVGNILDDVWEGGISISQDQDIQRNPDVASDGDGFLVVWDKHTTEHLYPDIYGIMVSKDGQVYQSEPVAISTAVWNQANPAVFWTENNYLCMWKDDSDGVVDVSWTRMNRKGELLNGAPEDGGTALGLDLPSCIYTPPGGAFFQATGIVVWEENYTGQLDLYAVELIPPVPPMLTWSGEPDYESDGVDPDTGYGGETFTFRILYKDSEGTPPQIAQLWIDMNKDQAFTFPDDQKIDMAIAPEESNPDYYNGVIFQAKTVLHYTGDNGIAYAFYFKDDIDVATGPSTEIAKVFVENNPPILSWCQREGYVTDGVDPDQAEGSYTFEFYVNYRDVEGNLPEVSEVWIDLDDSGTYEQRERFVMLEANQEEVTTGRNYKKYLKILYVGDGFINYRFLFTDGYHLAVGDPNQDDPTKNHTLRVLPHLMAPILSWPIEEDFQNGVKKAGNGEENLFIFKVGYRDPDNDPPVTRQVWLDLNGDGIFKEDERFNMVPADLQDTDYTEVNYYTLQKAISYSGEGEMVYKFVFDDGCNIATGEPFLEGGTISVDSPINLEWPSDEGFLTDGVEPDTGSIGISFEFKVIYFNQYGYPPNIKEVWIDENLDGLFDGDERYPMEDTDPGDMDYMDGKEYVSLIQYAGEEIGLIPYKFVFSDIYMPATGAPTQDGLTIEIVDDNDPRGRSDPVDQLAWDNMETKGPGCFIQTLKVEVPTRLHHVYEIEDPRKKMGTSFVQIWFLVFKFGLLTLLLMGMICFIMFSYFILKGGRSIPNRL